MLLSLANGFAFLTTTLSSKAIVLGPPALNAFLLARAWRARLFSWETTPLLLWGIGVLLLVLHTFLFAVDFPRSIAYDLRLAGFCLQVALMQMWLQKPAFILSALSIHPGRPTAWPLIGLITVCLGTLMTQLFWEGLWTRTLQRVLSVPESVPYTFKPHLAILTTVLFPLLSMCRTPVVPLSVGGVLICVTYSAASLTNSLALLAGLITFFSCRLCPRTTLSLLGGGGLLWLWVFPFVIPALQNFEAVQHIALSYPTLEQRLLHWYSVAPQILERPFAGWGIGQSAALSQSNDLLLPLNYPHNMFIELWLDLGFLGALGATCLWGLFLRKLFQLPSQLSSATTTGSALTVFALVMGHGGYSNLHFWWFSALTLCVFWVQLLHRMRTSPTPP